MSGPFDRRGADNLAYECAKQIQSGRLDARSAIGDALLDYLDTVSVPEWMDKYETENRKVPTDNVRDK